MSKLSSHTDSELIALIREDDLTAFNAIYHRHWQGLYQSAFNILRDNDMVMDILQEVFIWLWEHRSALQILSLKSYLHSAVKYKVANCIRHGKIRQTFFDEVQRAELSYTMDETLEFKELKAIVEQFTANLPERCKEVFTLSRMDFFTNKEIAARLGISEKTVENQITIALKKLRLSLGRISVWLFFFL